MSELDKAVDELLDMTDDEFADIVAADVRGELNEAGCRALRHDDVLDRWAEGLTLLYSRVDQQFAARKGESDPEARGWRGAARRFQGGIAARKAECRALTAERNRAEHAHRGVHRLALTAKTANTPEARAAAGEIALHRLCDLHPDDFKRLLAEEYGKAGLPVKAHWLPGVTA